MFAWCLFVSASLPRLMPLTRGWWRGKTARGSLRWINENCSYSFLFQHGRLGFLLDLMLPHKYRLIWILCLSLGFCAVADDFCSCCCTELKIKNKVIGKNKRIKSKWSTLFVSWSRNITKSSTHTCFIFCISISKGWDARNTISGTSTASFYRSPWLLAHCLTANFLQIWRL